MFVAFQRYIVSKQIWGQENIFLTEKEADLLVFYIESGYSVTMIALQAHIEHVAGLKQDVL